MRTVIFLAALSMVLVTGAPPAAVAQSGDDAAAQRPTHRVVRARPRIEVTPDHLLYRQCVDGYHEVWRPYWGGKVVMPYMHCWWVRG